MSEVEFGNAIFRGTLYGASGEVEFGLDAENIDAVQRINIKDGAISSNLFIYRNEQITAYSAFPGQACGAELCRTPFIVYEENTLVEMVRGTGLKMFGDFFDLDFATSYNSPVAPEALYDRTDYVISRFSGILPAGSYNFIDFVGLSASQMSVTVNVEFMMHIKLTNQAGFG